MDYDITSYSKSNIFLQSATLSTLIYGFYGELGEWLNQQIANLSSRNGRVSSNLTLSAKNMDEWQSDYAADCKSVLGRFDSYLVLQSK